MNIIKVVSLVGFLIFNLMFNVFQEKDIIKAKNNLSIGIVDLPEDLIYLSDNNYTSNVIIGNLFEGLVNLSSDGEVVSGIAERYTVSSDGLEYKFYLRNDAYMSTGEPITSKDFVKFFKEIVDKDKERFYYEELKSIKGMKDYYNGEISFDKVGIEFKKNDVLVINLEESDENFLKNLTKDKFSLRNNFKYLYNYKDFYEYISYSGAYVIDSIYNGDNGNLKIVLKPNQYYYLNNYKTVDEKVYSITNDKEIVFEVFPTREFALESYKGGKLNFLLDVAYNSIYDYFDSDQIYYVHNEDSNLVLDLDKYINEDMVLENERIAEVSISLDDEQRDENGNLVNVDNQKLQKGNFINFILDAGDIRYINGINGENLNKYKFNVDYLRDEFKKYEFDEKRVLKIVTHSDDNYIELARSLKNFLYEEFNLSCNIAALEDDYIKDKLTEDGYDILISKESNGEDTISMDFDKPSLVLSNIVLDNQNIDGNGTIVINNIS